MCDNSWRWLIAPVRVIELLKGPWYRLQHCFHLLSNLKFTISHNAISIGIVRILSIWIDDIKHSFIHFFLFFFSRWTLKILVQCLRRSPSSYGDYKSLMCNIIIIMFIKLKFVYFVFFLFVFSMFRVCPSHECRQMRWMISFHCFSAMNDDYANDILLHLRIRYIFICFLFNCIFCHGVCVWIR